MLKYIVRNQVYPFKGYFSHEIIHSIIFLNSDTLFQWQKAFFPTPEIWGFNVRVCPGKAGAVSDAM
jgi:hypothetical protein